MGLLQKDAAAQIGVDTATVTNWELGHTEPGERFIPALIAFLGYSPLPQPESLGQAVRIGRLARGWSHKRLASEAGVDPATVSRLECDCRGMAGRAVRAICLALGLNPAGLRE